MKAIFNDATEQQIQQTEPYGDYLRILIVGTTSEQIREIFSDPLKTKRIIIQERGQTIATYDDYTTLYRIEWSPGGIYTVVMYKSEKTPEVQAEVQQAAVLVAQMQAQALTDAQAITVKAIYPAWSPDGVEYPVDYKVLQDDVLYKCLQEHTSQENWAPGVAPSLWTAVASGEQAGTLEDPIPVPETVATAGMEYEKGKYYSEGGTVYLMDRQGMEAGDKITLYFAPSALIGQYFSVAE